MKNEKDFSQKILQKIFAKREVLVKEKKRRKFCENLSEGA